MNSKLAFALLTGLALSSSAGVALAQPAYDGDATRPVELVPTRTTTFAIEGMSCGRCATSISQKLNVNHETLRNWVRQAEVDDGQRSGVTTD